MEFDLKRDINKTIEMMEKSENGEPITDKNYLPPFPSATINHVTLYPQMKGRFSSFLGLTGSFAPALNAVYLGATDITCFDISAPVGYYAYYQIASILALEYDEYINFFYNHLERKSFNFDTYQKIREYLPSSTPMNAKKYFDVLYDYLGEEKIRRNFFKCIKHLFDIPVNGVLVIEQLNSFYLNKEAFYKLKSQLRKIRMKYLLCDIKDVPKLLVGNTYDKIYLSCAHSFIYEDVTVENMIDYFNLLNEYKKLLSDEGVLQAGYFYYTDFQYNPNKAFPWINAFEENGYEGITVETGLPDNYNQAYLYSKH